MGFGSVLNLQGHNYDYNESVDPDTLAIGNDWRVVGEDILNNLEKAKSESNLVAR
jgi:hypothetical protein